MNLSKSPVCERITLETRDIASTKNTITPNPANFETIFAHTSNDKSRTIFSIFLFHEIQIKNTLSISKNKIHD